MKPSFHILRIFGAGRGVDTFYLGTKKQLEFLLSSKHPNLSKTRDYHLYESEFTLEQCGLALQGLMVMGAYQNFRKALFDWLTKHYFQKKLTKAQMIIGCSLDDFKRDVYLSQFRNIN